MAIKFFRLRLTEPGSDEYEWLFGSPDNPGKQTIKAPEVLAYIKELRGEQDRVRLGNIIVTIPRAGRFRLAEYLELVYESATSGA